MKFEIDLSDYEQFNACVIIKNDIENINRVVIGCIDRELEDARKILLAFFGKKLNTFSNIRNVEPYHLTDHIVNISKELFTRLSSKRTFQSQQDVAIKLFNCISGNLENKRLYEPRILDCSTHFEMKWEELTSSLHGLGIKQTKEDLKKIVYKLASDQW